MFAPSIPRNAGLSERKTMQPSNTTAIDRALKQQEVADVFGISNRTLRRKINSGQFPRPDFFIGREPRWRLSTIERHRNELEERSDADRDAVRRRCQRQMSGKT